MSFALFFSHWVKSCFLSEGTQISFTFTQDKQTYKPHTLVGPNVTGPEQDPLAVTCLENQLYIKSQIFNSIQEALSG